MNSEVTCPSIHTYLTVWSRRNIGQHMKACHLKQKWSKKILNLLKILTVIYNAWWPSCFHVLDPSVAILCPWLCLSPGGVTCNRLSGTRPGADKCHLVRTWGTTGQSPCSSVPAPRPATAAPPWLHLVRGTWARLSYGPDVTVQGTCARDGYTKYWAWAKNMGKFVNLKQLKSYDLIQWN